MDAALIDKLTIIETVQNWAVWRDAGDWERFRTVWHDDGWMSATWFQGPAPAFIKVSKEGFEKGVFIRFVHRPLSRYLNAMADVGLTLERMLEPGPPQGFLDRAPEYVEAATIPRLLTLVARRA